MNTFTTKPLWILKKKKLSWGIFPQKWLNPCKTGFGEISFFVSYRLKSMFIVNFATMNRYFLPVNIVNNVFCGTFLGCIWSNHIELILWIKLNVSPFRSKLLRRTFVWYCFLPHTRCFELSFNFMDQVLWIRPSSQMRAFCFQLFSIRNLKKDGHT